MPEVRQVTDSKVLAALAHPLRRRLLDVLHVYGPATASALAAHTEQAVANVSHHLRVLHQAELLEEAPELARDRRERWWRPAATSLRWSTADFAGDPAGKAVAEATESLGLEQHAAAVRAWFGAAEQDREFWGDTAFITDKWLRLTPSELAELAREVIALAARWGNRTIPDDGQRREPVLLFGYGVPAKP